MSDHHEEPRAVDTSSPPDGHAQSRRRSVEELVAEQAIANDTHGVEPPVDTSTRDDTPQDASR